MALKISPKKKDKAERCIAVRIPESAYKTVTELAERYGYTRGEIVAMMVAGTRVIPARGQRAAQ